ncbi:MAG: cobalamin biosynthesis protein CbiG [Proteobacteria bacterium]|nr:cobalamin biosynthesis protein CbiG [Pseudomonadota bacterium]
MALFDRYLMVDWSGSSVPKLGRDSIWTGLIGEGRRPRLVNHPTRHAATAAIRAIMLDSVCAGRRLIAGFDFSFAYAAGFAGRLGLTGEPWRAVWKLLAREIVDSEDNANNRFAVAAALNQRLGGEAFPFWGCPERHVCPTLVMRKRRPHGPGDLAERRLSERVLKQVQPSWKLHYTGSVGGQTLVGIPRVEALRSDPALAPVTRVWPFETGFEPLTPRHLKHIAVLITEIYPSLIPVPDGDAVKDARQVEAMARFLLRHDRAGSLGALFAAPCSAAERTVIEREEGWIFGAGAYERPTAATPTARRRDRAGQRNVLPA